MKRLLPLVLLLTGIAGCKSAPKVEVLEYPYRTYNGESYSTFVSRRTADLQRMGGPFKDKKVAEQKARENAESIFGQPVPVSKVTWNSQNQSAQAELNEALDNMKRDRTR